MFRVSVITAVYNQASYVRQAVESAIAQEETEEVLLIEDGSTDDSLIVCQQLAEEYPQVKLYQHPNKKNHGYPASLNLGISRSQCEYIAFLDADDFYLPGRFTVTKQIFETDSTIDGVYEAIGIYIDSPEGQQRWVAAGRSLGGLTTVSEAVPPEKLFDLLIQLNRGNFSKDGLTVKRKAFELTGLFDEHLRLHQDTAMNLKLAGVCRLAHGQIEKPIAMRRIHETNRISAPRSTFNRYYTYLITFETVWKWGRKNLDQEKQQQLLNIYLDAAIAYPKGDHPLPVYYIIRCLLMLRILFKNPPLIGKKQYWLLMIPARLRRRYKWQI